jgi:Kef-type K+ transport system membrane component KefB/mannitol/fructose-specific phosphotransferase system IIA component
MLVPERRLLFTLFLSTIMTISAMPVSIRIMRDLGILRTDMGFLTISALSINDVIGWVVFTIMLGIFTHGQPDVLFVLRLVVLTVAFTALVFTVGRSLLDRLITVIRRRARDYTGYSLAVVALTGLGFGAITQSIGIHALFGFFLAGLAAGEAQNLTENTRNSISQMVYAVFVPVFFANIGLKVDVIGNFDIFLVVLLTALGIAVRFIGAWAGGMFAGIARGDRGTVAALHTPGGEMHIVIGALALELRLIDEVVFVAIVVAAILSSVTLGPWVSWLLKRISRALLLQIPRGSALDLAAMDKYDALEELCAAAAGEIQLNVQELYTAVEARERGMSTAIGDGLALPHARLEKIRKPTIIFGRSCAGIDWNAPDGAPTRLTFLILTPDDEKDSQLQIYRDLLSVLSKPQLRSSLCGAESPETAREALNDALLQHSKDAAGGI